MGWDVRPSMRSQRPAPCLVACFLKKPLTFLYTDTEHIRAVRLTTIMWVLWSVLSFQFRHRSTEVILDPNITVQ